MTDPTDDRLCIVSYHLCPRIIANDGCGGTKSTRPFCCYWLLPSWAHAQCGVQCMASGVHGWVGTSPYIYEGSMDLYKVMQSKSTLQSTLLCTYIPTCSLLSYPDCCTPHVTLLYSTLVLRAGIVWYNQRCSRHTPRQGPHAPLRACDVD